MNNHLAADPHLQAGRQHKHMDRVSILMTIIVQYGNGVQLVGRLQRYSSMMEPAKLPIERAWFTQEIAPVAVALSRAWPKQRKLPCLKGAQHGWEGGYSRR